MRRDLMSGAPLADYVPSIPTIPSASIDTCCSSQTIEFAAWTHSLNHNMVVKSTAARPLRINCSNQFQPCHPELLHALFTTSK